MADHVSKPEVLALLDLMAARVESLRRGISTDYLTRQEILERQLELQKLAARIRSY